MDRERSAEIPSFIEISDYYSRTSPYLESVP